MADDALETGTGGDSRPLVPAPFHCHARRIYEDLGPMPRHELTFDIEHALTRARALLPHGRRADRAALRLVAIAVAEHLELCRTRCFRKPPAAGHGTPPSC